MDIVEEFTSLVKSFMSASGVYPQQAIYRKQNEFVINAIAGSADLVFDTVKYALAAENVSELIFGIDITSAPNQGLTLTDAIIVGHYVNEGWQFGVINYSYANYENFVVEPIDWNNTYWSNTMESWKHKFTPSTNRD